MEKKNARELGRERGGARSLPSSLAIFSTSVPKISFSTISEPGTGYRGGDFRNDIAVPCDDLKYMLCV